MQLSSARASTSTSRCVASPGYTLPSTSIVYSLPYRVLNLRSPYAHLAAPARSGCQGSACPRSVAHAPRRAVPYARTPLAASLTATVRTLLSSSLCLLDQSEHIRVMASSRSGARAHPDLTVSPFEDMLQKISEAYTGHEDKVDKLVESFLHSARTIAHKAGLAKAADGSGPGGSSSGQWQPNGNVSDEHLQAALRSLDAVRVALAAPDRGVNQARLGGLGNLMVSPFCLTAFYSFQVIRGLTVGILSRRKVY